MNKVALITGGSRGIGRSICEKLAMDGYDIVVNYSGSKDQAKITKELCEKHGVNVIVHKADVSNFKEVSLMVDSIIKEFGRIDVLVNNAGITKDNLLLRMSEEDFDSVINVNLKGVFNSIKHVSKVMMKQRSGVIINMSSVIGVIGNVGQINYSASKAGILGITKSVAKELAPRNIRCNAIAPGFINSDMTEKLSDNLKETIMSQIPLKSFGEVDDISNLVSFLSSDSARYITGQVIHVDGGMVM